MGLEISEGGGGGGLHDSPSRIFGFSSSLLASLSCSGFCSNLGSFSLCLYLSLAATFSHLTKSTKQDD